MNEKIRESRSCQLCDEAPKEVEEAMIQELVGFVSDFAVGSQEAANDNKPPPRSSSALPETEEIKVLMTVGAPGLQGARTWIEIQGLEPDRNIKANKGPRTLIVVVQLPGFESDSESL